jgi:hypothetical protein
VRTYGDFGLFAELAFAFAVGALAVGVLDVTEAGLVERLVQLDAEDVHLLDAHAENVCSLGTIA